MPLFSVLNINCAFTDIYEHEKKLILAAGGTYHNEADVSFIKKSFVFEPKYFLRCTLSVFLLKT